tara:strand:- start:831 stop:1571 length:741 start_codon:yes stop_codon:yes gene_type:complete
MAFGAMMLSGLKALAPSLLQGGLSSLLGGGDTGPRLGSADMVRQDQARTQGLVDKNISLSEAMMDPNSKQNQMMRNMMSQRAMESGAQTGNQAMKMAAMKGVSPGQAMMAQRQAQNQASGGVNQHWQQAMQDRFSQGLNLNQNMIGRQQGLDQNIGQFNIANKIAEMNAQQPSGPFQGGGLMGGIGGLLGNIGSYSAAQGTTPENLGTGLFGNQGGFMSQFGTGSGWLSGLGGGGGTNQMQNWSFD